MEKEYSPSHAKLWFRRALMIVLAVGLLVLLVVMAAEPWPEESPVAFLMLMPVWIVVMFCGVIVFRSYYPVFLSDRLVVANALSGTFSREYHYKELECAKVAVTAKGNIVLSVAVKNEEHFAGYFVCIRRNDVEDINCRLREMGVPTVSERKMGAGMYLKSMFLKSPMMKFMLIMIAILIMTFPFLMIPMM